MENKDISQIVLEKIKESGMKPISRNIFNLKRVLVWFFLGFAILIGVVSFAITLTNLFNNDWYLVNKFGFTFIFKSLPYFWFVCLIIFSILGEFYYRKTYLGYRHRVVMVIGAYIVVTVSFGLILFLFNIGEKIEEKFFNNMPIYRMVTFDKSAVWSQPDAGLISGRIISINDNSIQIMDFNNNIWLINKNEAMIAPRVKMDVGEIIKIIGDKDNDSDEIFNAVQIRPWLGGNPNRNCCTVR